MEEYTIQTVAAGREKLEKAFKERFPGIDRSNPREQDRELIRSGTLTENELLAMYNAAYGVPETEEDEVDIPPLPDVSLLEFFNSNICLPPFNSLRRFMS